MGTTEIDIRRGCKLNKIDQEEKWWLYEEPYSDELFLHSTEPSLAKFKELMMLKFNRKIQKIKSNVRKWKIS